MENFQNLELAGRGPDERIILWTASREQDGRTDGDRDDARR